MRDIAFAMLVMILVAMAVRRPFNALLLWAFGGLIALDAYTYGFMVGFPYGSVFGGCILVAFFLNREQLDYKLGGAAFSIFFLMLLHCWVVGASAFPNLARNAEYTSDISKTLVFCLLLPFVITTATRLHAFLWVVFLSIGVHALIEGLRFIVTGGSHRVMGVSKFGDNNHLAVFCVMLIPLGFHLRRYLPYAWARHGMTAVLMLLVVSVVATGSRGGFIALLGLGLVFTLMSQRKMLGLLGVGLVVSLIFAFAPDSWLERMNSIKSADQSLSFQGRLAAWQTSTAIALNNPVTGGGFHAVENGIVWLEHQDLASAVALTEIDDLGEKFKRAKAAHSIYFEVLGDQGFVGLFYFLLLLAVWAWAALRLRAGQVGIAEDHWSRSLGAAMMCSLGAFAVGGAGVSIAYYDLHYYMASLTFIARKMTAISIPRQATQSFEAAR